MIRILIVGSKGFIGQHAYEYFSAKSGHKCWGADVVVDYVDDHYFLIDSTQTDFNEIFETVAFDICINCSGAASVPDSLKHPLRDFTLNAFNVVKILEALRRHAPHCKLINLSSAAVYGNPKSLPIRETDVCQPVSPYGKHKLIAEELCREYYEYFDVGSCSVRIFSAYGPGLKKQLFWDIYQKSLYATDLLLYGTGMETRDFVYVEDILDALNLIIHKGNFEAEVYNIASGIEVTISDAASQLLMTLNFGGSVKFSGSGRLGDPLYWRADISRIKSFGFEPKFTIQNGIKRYVEWLREERLH